MKKFSALIILSMLLLVACTSEDASKDTSIAANKNENNETNEIDEVEEVEEEKELTEAELEAIIEEQPLKVVDTNYLIQDEEYKSLYPDMLQAIVENQSGEDIKDAIVAFVGWDKNGLPVKLQGSFDFSGGAYYMPVQYNDINLIDGEQFGDKNGYEIDESVEVEEFKAIVESYETFEGDTWKNEYIDDFKNLYEGQKRK